MNIPDYIDLAIKSAKLYHEYLSRTPGKGEFIIPVLAKKRITRGNTVLYRLKLRRAPFSLDAVCLVVNHVKYAPDYIKYIGWEEDTMTLTIAPPEDVQNLLDIMPCASISLSSDMRFLVKCVFDWYKNPSYSGRISFPDSPSMISAPDIAQYLDPPSEEQEKAVKGIFQYPITYIWGAPGTGKTKFVLAYALMNYLKAGKRVLICAPTNNAVDQTLLGVLSVLEEHHLKTDRILRLGTPGKEIMTCYPYVCEHRAVSRKLEECQRKILQITNVLETRLHNEKISALALKFCPYALHYQKQHLGWVEAQQTLPLLSEKRNRLLKEERKLYREEETAQKKLYAQNKKMTSALYQFLFQLSEKKERKERNSLEQLNREYSSIFNQRKRLVEEIESLFSQSQTLITNNRRSSQELFEEFRNLCKLNSIPELSDSITICDMGNLYEICCRYFEQHRREESFDQLYADYSISDLKQRLEFLEQEKNLYNSAGVQFRDAQIVAVTADALFNRYDYFSQCPEPFDHFFMDEAAYCPLIKTMIAFSFGCPVTFLGDHRQLPPVCEWDSGKLSDDETPLAELWNAPGVLNDFIFGHIRLYILNHTYRFGQKIAEILANEVYTSEFYGDKHANTTITVLHAPDSTKDFVSPSETIAISDFISKTSVQDYVILAPYKKQKELLEREIPQAAAEHRVMTIHASQGREWNTVFLSVTDTKQMFFMHSKLKKSNGLQIINTAVSRAKRNLVIVCDYNLWICREDQLIGKIIKNADEIINSPED